MILPLFLGTLGVAMAVDAWSHTQASPQHPHFGAQGRLGGRPALGLQYRSPGQGSMGMRGPTSSWRHPVPRPWETGVGGYGAMIGSGGIRGGSFVPAFSRSYMDAVRRDDAAQGWQGVSIAPQG